MSIQNMKTLKEVCKDLGLRVSGVTGFGYIIDGCGLHASKVLLPPESDPAEHFPNTVGFPCVKIYQQGDLWFVLMEYTNGEISSTSSIQIDIVSRQTVKNAVSKLYAHCPLEWERV
jgi:hypothetical protein